MSGDCGHGWGYHLVDGGPCFQCEAHAMYRAWRNEKALKTKVADLKKRLRLARSGVGPLVHLPEYDDITDALDLRKPLRTKGKR